MQIKPLDNRVLIKPADPEEKTASGLYLPQGAKEKPQQGTIVAVGPGRLLKDGKRAPIAVKKGEKVVYGRYAGSEIELKGVKHVILEETELLGVIEK